MFYNLINLVNCIVLLSICSLPFGSVSVPGIRSVGAVLVSYFQLYLAKGGAQERDKRMGDD